jgi:hypothetical protein
MTFPFIRPYNIFPSQAGGGGTDNTPNTVNWTDFSYDDGSSQGGIVSQQITGITSGIYVRIQPGTGSSPELYYQIGSSNLAGTRSGAPSSPWSLLSSNTDVIVSGNQWLSFTCFGAGFSSRNGTVLNLSDGNATLDTFTYQIITT